MCLFFNSTKDGKSTDGESTDEDVRSKNPPKTAGSIFMR